MLNDQGGSCFICNAERGDKTRDKLFVDHCHTSGEVRGLLCGRCNTAIGMLEDDPSLVTKALNYLINNGEVNER